MRPAGPNGAPCDMPPGALAEDDYPKCGQIGTSGPPRAPRTAFAPGMFFENRPGGQAPGTDRSGPFFQAGLFSPRTPPQHRASIAGSISGVRRRHHCTRTGTANATRPTRRATAEARPTVARSMADAGSTAGQGSRGGPLPASHRSQRPGKPDGQGPTPHLPNHIASSGGRPGNTATPSNFGRDPFSSPSHRPRRPRLLIPLRLAHRVDIQAEACIQPSQPKLSRRLGCHLAT